MSEPIPDSNAQKYRSILLNWWGAKQTVAPLCYPELHRRVGELLRRDDAPEHQYAELIEEIEGAKTKTPPSRRRSSERRRPRGRPRGSDSAAEDCKLYHDWKALKRARGITKEEFLRERGLPLSDLAAIERGRAQEKRRSGQK